MSRVIRGDPGRLVTKTVVKFGRSPKRRQVVTDPVYQTKNLGGVDRAATRKFKGAVARALLQNR